MKFLSFLICVSLLAASCNTSTRDQPSVLAPDSTITSAHSDIDADTAKLLVSGPSSEIEKTILDRVALLPEFKKSNSYIDSLTNHKHGLASMIFKPTAKEKDYYVRVGYNGDERFETYYNFYVDSSTLKIRIADPLAGDITSLDEWRKREAQRN